MDPRLRGAVDASVGWYEDLCTLHGVGSVLVDGLWSALGTPPPLHSDAVVVEPAVTADQVLARLEGRDRGGVKDSFATMDLSGDGLGLLFSATWIHRPAAPPGMPAGWAAVTSPAELFAWTGRHDTRDVLLPPLLQRAHFRILARYADDRIVAGAVARLGSGTVDLSNVYAVPGHGVDWAELAAVAGAFFPGRPLVGYERGEALAAALAGGFAPVGDLRVWVRPAVTAP
ncbi:hypothetical protein BJ973_000930 [Actinoplanes tereljensis]|uniref:Uncharacterized protein n=1 Tax=Paractinoplanes tereljensis TaxID=571912 RepID=A0A919NR39_9ACTN|nr:hypothetical protein [Actinoplanes tereljensis]GIF22710.1 hypothetical protein Ate02nite_54400 [Actinoplanes tereljensis]